MHWNHLSYGRKVPRFWLFCYIIILNFQLVPSMPFFSESSAHLHAKPGCWAISAGFFGKLTTATNRIVTKLPVNKPVINQSGIFSLIPPGKSRRILLKIVVHHPSTCSKSGKISSIPSAASIGESAVKLCSTPANSSGFKAGEFDSWCNQKTLVHYSEQQIKRVRVVRRADGKPTRQITGID